MNQPSNSDHAPTAPPRAAPEEWRKPGMSLYRTFLAALDHAGVLRPTAYSVRIWPRSEAEVFPPADAVGPFRLERTPVRGPLWRATQDIAPVCDPPPFNDPPED